MGNADTNSDMQKPTSRMNAAKIGQPHAIAAGPPLFQPRPKEVKQPARIEMIENEIRPQHEGLLRVLCAEFGLRGPDIELQRLAFAIIGMGIHFFVAQDIVQALAPEVMEGPGAIDALAYRLAEGALAMIEAERRRRSAQPRPARRRSTR